MSCCNSDARYFRRPNKRCCRQHPTSDDNTYSLAAKIPTLAPLQMANISLLWWPAGSGEFPFFADDCMKLHYLRAGLENPETICFACHHVAIWSPYHNITRDHHPSSNLALHWPSHPSKKTTPSCQVDLLICTQKKRLVEDFPKMIFSGALRSLTDWIDWCRKTCDLIERMPLNQPFCTPLKLTSLLQKWCKLGISHG